MVIYRDLFWGTSWDPVGLKNFVDVYIMVVACPLQDCCCISCGDYDVVDPDYFRHEMRAEI